LPISRHASPRGGFLFEIRFPKRAHWQINRGLRDLQILLDHLENVNPSIHYLRAGAGEPHESFPQRNGRSGWGPVRHHRFPSDSTHSGFIIQAFQERGLPQLPLGVTRFRVTFPNSGIFPFICGLHDQMGMVGR
jgi:hypothetical protein